MELRIGLSKNAKVIRANGAAAISPVAHSNLSDSSDSISDFVHPDEDEYYGGPPVNCPVPHSDGVETLNAIFPAHVDALFTMLFTNSKFFLDLHTSRNSVNVHQYEWNEDPQTGKKRRVVSMTVSLSNLMGPKHAHVTETQLMHPVSHPGIFYAIDSESVNAGIPYADTFLVTIHYCMTRLSPSETRLVVVNSIKYKKSVWGITKSIIEKNCWAGLEEFYSHLGRALAEECHKLRLLIEASPASSPNNHDGGGGEQGALAVAESSNSLQRRRPRRRPQRKMKGKAPDVPPIMIPIPLIPRSGLRNGSIVGVRGVRQDNMGIGTVGSFGCQTEATVVNTEVDLAAANGPYSMVVKIILGVLGVLLLLNAFVFIRLTRLENAEPSLISPQTFTFTGELPQSHQDWLTVLQKQEALHREELQKWHEILLSALRVLQNAESDLEALKQHISTYNEDKYSLDVATNIQGSQISSEKDTKPPILLPHPSLPEEGLSSNEL